MKTHLAIIAMILIGLLVLIVPGHALARASGRDDTAAAEKVKAKVAKLGVGEKARAQITLRNGRKLKGYVRSAGQDSFDFTESGLGQITTIAYSDVAGIKKPGLSTGAKIGIAAAIGIGVTAIAIGVGLKGKIGSPF